MDKVMKTKRDLEIMTSCSSGYKTNSEKFFLLVITKFDDVM